MISALKWGSVLILLAALCEPLQAQWIETPGSGGYFDTLGNRLYVANGGVDWTSDDGNTWNWAAGGLPTGDEGISLAHIGNILISGTIYNGIFYSTDSGSSWNPSNTTPGYLGPAFFAMTEHDGYLFAGSNSFGIYRSSDSGRDWELDSNGIGETSSWYAGSYCFAAYDSLLLSGSPLGEVYRTSDDGNHWQVVSLHSPNDLVQALAVIGRTVIAGTRDGAYRSTDLGLTWTKLDTSLFYHGPSSLLTVNGSVIAGLDYTVVRSEDSGQAWKAFSLGWPSGIEPEYLIVFGAYFFAGSGLSPSLWRRPISDLAGVSNSQVVNSNIRSYPNPFSQSTTISFTSKAPGYADVRIVNQLGVEMAHLYSGELSAGYHSFVWSNPTGLPAGMYECLVRMNGQTRAIPIVLTR